MAHMRWTCVGRWVFGVGIFLYLLVWLRPSRAQSTCASSGALVNGHCDDVVRDLFHVIRSAGALSGEIGNWDGHFLEFFVGNLGLV